MGQKLADQPRIKIAVTHQSRLQDGQIEESECLCSNPDLVIEGVVFKGNHLRFGLSDGHSVAIHLLLYPRLLDASESQRGNWKLVAGGKEIRWSEIGEDISIGALLAFKSERYRVNLLDA
jgi:hypothetical protein